MAIPLSILDLATVGQGITASQALSYCVELAQHGEKLGFKRHWFAEHHGMQSVASSAPEILMAHIAASTSRIRVGSGGIMLPNHVPLKIAESFHTLEALHPGRIDFGIGRAPGTNQITLQALRSFDPSKFSAQMAEMLAFSNQEFPSDHPFSSIRVMPDDVKMPPIWILGSSGASARYAGEMGFGYSFASHFSPTSPLPAFQAYRDSFQPSEQFPEPHIILAVAVICADTDEEADFLAGSWDLSMLQLRKGLPGPFPTPEEARDYPYNEMDRAFIAQHRQLQFIGSPETVHRKLSAFVEETQADELMIATFAHGHDERMHSLELLANAWNA